MATRYSGTAIIRVTYEDRGDYKASVSDANGNLWRGRIGAPAAGFGPGIAYDSPKAYDSTAHAALSFADEDTDGDVGNAASSDLDGSGWHIGRSKAARYPTERNPSRRVANPRKRKARPKKRSKASYVAAAKKGAATRRRNARKGRR